MPLQIISHEPSGIIVDRIELYVLDGLTDTLTELRGDTFIGWLSSDVGPKTQIIPDHSGSMNYLTINDLEGTASEANPITALGDGIIGNNDQVYTQYGSLTLLDTSFGWVVVA